MEADVILQSFDYCLRVNDDVFVVIILTRRGGYTSMSFFISVTLVHFLRAWNEKVTYDSIYVLYLFLSLSLSFF